MKKVSSLCEYHQLQNVPVRIVLTTSVWRFRFLHLWEQNIDRGWGNRVAARTSSMKSALWKTHFDLSLHILHMSLFIGVLGQSSESLHFLTEQWAENEHVGSERTNHVDPFLWISFFSSFQPSSLDPKLFVPPLLRVSAQPSFISFSIHLFFLSFTTVASSGQLLNVALWRTKPGFVDMVTERRDGWG